MACTIISTLKRPNKTVSWHTNVFALADPAFTAEAEKVQLAQRRKITEVDDLTLEIEVTWESKSDYEDFMNIELVKKHFDLLAVYNQTVQITQDPKQFIES